MTRLCSLLLLAIMLVLPAGHFQAQSDGIGGGTGNILFVRSGMTGYQLVTKNLDSNQEMVLIDVGSPEWFSYSPDGTMIAYVDGWNKYLFVMDASGTGVRQLTNGENYTDLLVWSPDSKRVTYTAPGEDGTPDIFTVDVDTRATQNLTNAPGIDTSPSWSADGTELAYIRQVDDAGEIFVLDIATGESRQVTQTPDNERLPSWSPDGTQLLFSVYNQPGQFIGIVNADGSSYQQFDMEGADEPKWSPDGTQIAFFQPTGNEPPDIFVMNADGSNLINISNNSATNIWLNWSPDGEYLVFVSIQSGNFDLYIARRDGSNPRNVTNAAQFEEIRPQWQPALSANASVAETVAPAGQLIYVRYYEDNSNEIFTYDFDIEFEQKSFDMTVFNPWFTAWSPDNSQVVVQLIIDDVMGLHLIDVASGARRLLAEGEYPVWSPDGSMIAYIGACGEFMGLYLITPQGENQGCITEAIRFPDQEPVWSPDGTRIAFTGRSETGRDDIYVMTVADSSIINLTNTPDTSESYPQWLPDSMQIMFVSESQVSITDGMITRNFAETDGARYAQLSNDGTRILFPCGNNLCVINIDGSNLIQLTFDRQRDTFSRYTRVWSPDDQFIAFEKHVTDETWDVYIVSSNGGLQQRITTTGTDETVNAWR